MTTEELKASIGGMIWKTATSLVHGGKVSPVQFMDFMLGALFYRFISENVTKYCNGIKRPEDPDYVTMPDEMAERAKRRVIVAKGFFIKPSQLFINVANNAHRDPELNVNLSNIFHEIEGSALGSQSEADMKGLFSNFNTNDPGLGSTVKERNALLTTLLCAVRDLNFDDYKDSGLDVFGICYEHLIKMYALNSGTKGGEFYTPGEVSFLLAKIAVAERKMINKVYDPACGSGSLLLNFAKVLEPDNIKDGFFGQEILLKTYNLCRMNMFLHNVNFDHFDIQQGDTLLEPKHTSYEPFDAIVSNPPYSSPWAGDEDATLINDPRFSPAGVLAPRSKADLAFTMHILAWLSTTGTAAIVEFPGVLYRGGNEQKIRQYLVKNNYVDTVIQLPQNLFFGTSIATSIIVLKKNKTDDRICFIDASEQFVHGGGNKNKLSDENIEKIYRTHWEKTEAEHFSRVVRISDVEAQDWNLSVSTYVEPHDQKEEVSIEELNRQIAEVVERQVQLRASIDDIITNMVA